MAFYKQWGGRDKDAGIIKIVVSMRMKGLSELLHGEDTMEQILRYTRWLAYYGDSGFGGMMKQYMVEQEGSVE